MKKLTVYGLALLLVTGTTTALAGGRDHRSYSSGHHYKHRSHNNHFYKSHSHRKHHRYSHGYYRPRHFAHSYLGAALVGSALTHSLYHTHNGARCYDNHSNDRYRQRTEEYSEVVGCHRIERLADGSERRVELPMEQCQ